MTFYFYDLETTSGSPRDGRIMQFAGQRTDESMQPVGEPDNIIIKLADDVLPEPDAILVHGITPQKTLAEGVTEADFANIFINDIAKTDTVFIGYNNIRFDDEFMRRILYRTFYDPYQWHWQNGKSRWDLLDAIRMMRALRPEGLKWPFIDDKPTVKLELLAKENKILHENAHDALSDVMALIDIARIFKQKQPKLFEYLVKMRDKKEVAKLVNSNEPFIYTSGKYSSENEKTTVVQQLFKHPRREGAVVYDLRNDPRVWLKKSTEELVTHWQAKYNDDTEQLPVKTIQFNRCPAIAPLGVLDDSSKERIGLNTKEIIRNRAILLQNGDFIEKLEKALDVIEKKQQAELPLDDNVDNQLYDGFWGMYDQRELEKVRQATPEELDDVRSGIKNKRIREMIPLYKARNYPNKMNPEDIELWEEHKQKVFYGGGEKSKFAKFSKRMQELSKTNLTENQKYLLTELQLYAESILPEPEQN